MKQYLKNPTIKKLKNPTIKKITPPKIKKITMPGVRFGPPPKKGPNPQGLKEGGCIYRRTGAKSDIQGIKDIQKSGKKFIGVK
jgi:hypothetical protein